MAWQPIVNRPLRPQPFRRPSSCPRPLRLDFTVSPLEPAALARQLLSTGKVDSVYIYGNIISVDITKGSNADGLGDVVRNMYQYWKPGMEMPTFDAPAEEAPAAASGGESAGGAVESAYDKLVPQSLRERSAAALAKWQASQ